MSAVMKITKTVFLVSLASLLIIGLLFISGCSSNEGSDGEEIVVGVDSDVMSIDNGESNEDNNDGSYEVGESMENSIVVFETSKGKFEIELFLDKMPITAGNFEKLVSEGFYDGTRFHRVIANFMIQGGDPQSKDESLRSRWGTGGPGYSIEDEHVRGDELSNVRGSISMANSGPSSGGSQFFINVVDNTFLDWDKAPSSSKHPVFGKVVSGMDIVDSIVNVETGPGDQPVEEVVLTKIYIKE
jgi:peptidylprolyl isomerase